MRTRDLLRLKKDTEYLLMGSCDYVYILYVQSVKSEDEDTCLWHGCISPINHRSNRTGLFISYETEQVGYGWNYKNVQYPVLTGVAGDPFIRVCGSISLYDFELIGEYNGVVDLKSIEAYKLHKRISNKRSK